MSSIERRLDVLEREVQAIRDRENPPPCPPGEDPMLWSIDHIPGGLAAIIEKSLKEEEPIPPASTGTKGERA